MSEMAGDDAATDLTKCGPAAPGKKWVCSTETETCIDEATGTFSSKDVQVWKQVDDDGKPAGKKAAAKSMGAKPYQRPMPKDKQKPIAQKRAPLGSTDTGKKNQAGLASFFWKK